MCGLAGVFSPTEPIVRRVAPFDLAQTLLQISTIRGMDSTGLLIVTKNGKKLRRTVVKEAIDACGFYTYGKGVTISNKEDPVILMGHTRAATFGKITDANAHPFTYGNITLAHNGSLVGEKQLPNWEDGMVDSEWICKHLSEKGLQDTIDEMSGAYALTWYDHKKKTFNVYRNSLRKLYYATLADNKTIVYASEDNIIRAAVTHEHLALNTPNQVCTLFEENVHYEWSGKMEPKKTKMEKTYTKGYYSNNLRRANEWYDTQKPNECSVRHPERSHIRASKPRYTASADPTPPMSRVEQSQLCSEIFRKFFEKRKVIFKLMVLSPKSDAVTMIGHIPEVIKARYGEIVDGVSISVVGTVRSPHEDWLKEGLKGHWEAECTGWKFIEPTSDYMRPRFQLIIDNPVALTEEGVIQAEANLEDFLFLLAKTEPPKRNIVKEVIKQTFKEGDKSQKKSPRLLPQKIMGPAGAWLDRAEYNFLIRNGCDGCGKSLAKTDPFDIEWDRAQKPHCFDCFSDDQILGAEIDYESIERRLLN